MKLFNKSLFFLGLLSAIVYFSSCKKTWLDVNNDPNRVTDANITPELIFPAAANEVGQAAVGNTFLQEWIGYLAPNGGFVPQQNVVSYNLDFTFGDALFQSRYNTLFDLHLVKIKGLANGDTALAAASMILSAKLFQEVTDLYGDVPYTQAFQVNLYPTPAYDQSQSIYNALQLQLDTAINYLQNTTPPNAFPGADIINNGNVLKWIKFANTLKLRLLIRQSEVSGFDPSTEIAKIKGSSASILTNILGAAESISVNPGYVNDVNKQQPFYANNGWTPSGTQANLSTDANIYILNILSNTNDPRIERFFYPGGFDASNGFVGNTFGDPVGTLALASQSSYFGPALVGELNSSNVGTGYSNKQFIYPSYESLFLYAEAVARGWVNDDADGSLAAAITESFVWTGLTASDATTYIAANPSITKVSLATTPDDKDRIVAYQKYLANTEIDPQESFFDQNRLHFLTDDSYISTLPTKISNVLPFRLLYPQSEYTTNGKNTPAQVAGDEFTKKLFWQP